MAKELILMQDVDGLGAEGEVVKVAEGYARNYLLPRKLAAPMNRVNQRRLERMQEAFEQRRVAKLAEAQQRAASLEKVSCTIPMKVGDQGQLFGAIHAAQIEEALREQGLDINRKMIKLDEPLRELGVFNVPLELHPEVSVNLKVWVVEE